MSVQRSPTGCDSNARLGGSQPNLAEMNPTYEIRTNITQRKRKDTDDNAWIKAELSDIKKQMSDMMALITASSSFQEEKIEKLSEDVTTIKNQVNDIGTTIANIIIDQNNAKVKIDSLQTTSDNIERKIELLESEINNLKDSSPLSTLTSKSHQNYEDIVHEVNERSIRSKNIVIIGIPEASMTTDRRTYNNNEVAKIIKKIYDDCPDPLKVIRLGKFKPDRTRAIKVCFASKETATFLLRNKGNVKFDNNSIKIFSDQTPIQRKHLQNLKVELEKRINNGENNLAIKYVKGIPKIIENIEEKQKEKIMVAKN